MSASIHATPDRGTNERLEQQADHVSKNIHGPIPPELAVELRERGQLEDVRIHTDADASANAKALDAKAFTVGTDISFDTGQFAPETTNGAQLLAHELTHVAQQQQSGTTAVQRSGNESEAAALGKIFERPEAMEWAASLKKQGYEVYTRKDFHRVDWLKAAFPDNRARPDLVAVNHGARKLMVGDVAAGPWTDAALKPGDKRKLPNDLTRGETKPHIEKTIENAKQVARSLPEPMKGYEVTAKERWWKKGGYSREIVVQKGSAPRAAPVKPPATAKPPVPKPAPKAEPPKAIEPPPKAIEPAAPKSEPIPATKGAPKGGRFGGFGGVLSIGGQLAAGWIHQRVAQKRIEAQAQEKGWVPYNSPSGEGLLYDLGSWLLDPTNSADVGLGSRFNIKVWRENIRAKANAMGPGATLPFTWQVGGKIGILGTQEITDQQVVYFKRPDGKWMVLSSEMSDPPDLNAVIDPDVPDWKVESMLGLTSNEA